MALSDLTIFMYYYNPESCLGASIIFLTGLACPKSFKTRTGIAVPAAAVLFTAPDPTEW